MPGERGRVSINPEVLRAIARSLLRDPVVRSFVGVVEVLAPDVADAVRELDTHLPDVVAAVELEARERLANESKHLAKRGARAIRGLVDEALTKTGKRAPKATRLRGGSKKGKP